MYIQLNYAIKLTITHLFEYIFFNILVCSEKDLVL